ncbi:hypothetical protein ACLOJK_039242 [Asimina triloba]
MVSSSTPSALHQPEPPSAPQIPVGNQMSTFDFDYSGAWHHITDRTCRAEDPTKRKQLADVSIPSAVRRPMAAGVRPRAGVRPPIYVGEQLHPMTPSSSSCSTHSIADPEGKQSRPLSSPWQIEGD